MTGRTCPICRKTPPAAPYTPFCSKHCADVDLQRWFAGAYAIPAGETDDARDSELDAEADEG